MENPLLPKQPVHYPPFVSRCIIRNNNKNWVIFYNSKSETKLGTNVDEHNGAISDWKKITNRKDEKKQKSKSGLLKCRHDLQLYATSSFLRIVLHQLD